MNAYSVIVLLATFSLAFCARGKILNTANDKYLTLSNGLHETSCLKLLFHYKTAVLEISASIDGQDYSLAVDEDGEVHVVASDRTTARTSSTGSSGDGTLYKEFQIISMPSLSSRSSFVLFQSDNSCYLGYDDELDELVCSSEKTIFVPNNRRCS